MLLIDIDISFRGRVERFDLIAIVSLILDEERIILFLWF